VTEESTRAHAFVHSRALAVSSRGREEDPVGDAAASARHHTAVVLGHASVKTTSIYLASGEDRQEHIVRLRERGRPTLDHDREAA
jgi:hypothetical protein